MLSEKMKGLYINIYERHAFIKSQPVVWKYYVFHQKYVAYNVSIDKIFVLYRFGVIGYNEVLIFYKIFYIELGGWHKRSHLNEQSLATIKTIINFVSDSSY